MFTSENTTGYTDAELTDLNAEWDAIVARDGLEPETDEYYAAEKQFADVVSRATTTLPLNEQIRAAREAAGLTQHETAAKVPGLTDGAYGDIERSGRYVAAYEKIAAVLAALKIGG